ncbi:hypothetical protein pipiens_012284, partial [Culex pipiens pipiens]
MLPFSAGSKLDGPLSGGCPPAVPGEPPPPDRVPRIKDSGAPRQDQGGAQRLWRRSALKEKFAETRWQERAKAKSK